MHIAYWAHSYREEDAPINKYFGLLIEEGEGIIVNFDPPSKSVNGAKLEGNLRSCDGMVAVLSWRATGPSPFILFEIGMCLRARKPLLVYIDDRLPDGLVPRRVLQRRYSSRTYFRQVRNHTHALREFKEYLGESPPPPYQPSSGQRTCGLAGFGGVAADRRDAVEAFVGERGYRPIDLDAMPFDSPVAFDPCDHLACLDVSLGCADSASNISQFWRGAIHASVVPEIALTFNPDLAYSDAFPREFQPRRIHPPAGRPAPHVLADEFDLFEQQFLSAEDPAMIERYTRMQVDAGRLQGRYEDSTRQTIAEVVMGDKYEISGQAGAVGRGAHAHHMSFTQRWDSLAGTVDLKELTSELQRLREAMEREAVDPAHRLAIGAVAAAAESAARGEGPKVLEYLKAGGRWTLSLAEKIGVGLATAAIKSSLGM